MTQKFRFVGDGPVDLPELALVEVNRGTHVEVDDPERAKSMHASPDWEHVPDKARSRAAKKAARRAPAEKAPAAPRSEVKSPEASPDSEPVAPSENRDAEQEN